MKDIYTNGSYLKSNRLWHSQDSFWKATQILKFMERHKLNPVTICDVGCGAGEVLYVLSEKLGREKRLYGYDISPQAIDLCRKKTKANIQFENRDILEEKNAHFDLMLIIDVFEHVENYLGFLRQLRIKAKYKIFHIPLDLSVQWVLRSQPIMKTRKKVGHLHHFTKDTALATLKEAGYDILDHCYTAGSLEIPRQGWKTKLLKLPRTFAYAIHKDLTVRILGGYSVLVLTK